MFRFTIRDVLWLTAIVALAVGILCGRSASRGAFTSPRDRGLDSLSPVGIAALAALGAWVLSLLAGQLASEWRSGRFACNLWPQRFRFRLRTLFVIVTASALLCAVVPLFRVWRGEDVTASEANRRLWNCHVPENATDVWFVTSYRGTRVECTLSEPDFRKWCLEQGSHPIAIDTNQPQYIYSAKSGGTWIRNGLFFKDGRENSDVWLRGVFDAAQNRVYLEYSGG